MNDPVLVIDNYDSFVYNLVHLIREIEGCEPVVRRNDALSLEEARAYHRIVLSPGPGIPQEAGCMPDLVAALAPTHRLLGVCLGHQCIAEVFGAALENLSCVVHGRAMVTEVCVDDLLFRGLGCSVQTGRYHSWVVANEGFPECLEVTARDAAGTIMALRHRDYDVRGVQFHPESILTDDGASMMRNWLQGDV